VIDDLYFIDLVVVDLVRHFVTFCKIAPYINSLTYLLTYLVFS